MQLQGRTGRAGGATHFVPVPSAEGAAPPTLGGCVLAEGYSTLPGVGVFVAG